MRHVNRCPGSWLALVLLAGCGSRVEYDGRTIAQWIDALNEKDLTHRQQAVDHLVTIGPDATTALKRALDDDDRDIRSGAAAALVRQNPQQAAEVVQRIKQGSIRGGISLAAGLPQAHAEETIAIRTVLAGLESADPKVRHHAIQVLGDLGPDSAGAAPALGDALTDVNENIRWRAAYALIRLGPGAREATPQLIQALNDSDTRVREGATKALGAIGPAAGAEARDRLTTALKDRDEEVRHCAAEVLKQWEATSSQAAVPPNTSRS